MKNTRILVIEDNVDNLDLVCFLLEQAGCVVLQARDGQVGLDMAREQLPDMLLLDMSIPEIDGWTVARMLKEDPNTQKICIVALTAHILPRDRKKAFEVGCDGYISKPLDIPNFVDQVTGYLEKFRETSENGF